MGGNVFKGQTRRYSKEEYFELVDDLEPLFRLIFTKYKVCPAMKDKESFGDMDVVCVPRTPLDSNKLKFIFDTDFVSKNGSTWSLAYKEFQLDLITSPESEYEFCKFYTGEGDRGNFIGKVAHQLGLKFGHDGLWMPVRLSSDHVLGSVLLTDNPLVACKFLDVEVLSGFDTITDMFESVAKSKYFNPESFRLENNNNIARVRDRKRPNYHLFLEWMDTLPKKDWFPRSKDRSVYFDLVFETFPHAKKEFEALLERKKMLDLAATKFNGNLVSEWTGLTGIDLGMLMRKLKETLVPSVVVTMSDEELKQFTMENV